MDFSFPRMYYCIYYVAFLITAIRDCDLYSNMLKNKSRRRLRKEKLYHATHMSGCEEDD